MNHSQSLPWLARRNQLHLPESFVSAYPASPAACCEREIRGAEETEAPAREMIESASELAQFHRAAGPLAKRLLLLGPRAATLNQDNQDDDNQHTGNSPNNRCTIHAIPLS